MGTHQRIAQGLLAEHSAIAERLHANPTVVLAYVRDTVARWSKDFALNARPRWLVEWERLLGAPLDALIVTLITDSEAAARLRSKSPFLGRLTLRERLEILRQADLEMALALEGFNAGRSPYAAGSGLSARR